MRLEELDAERREKVRRLMGKLCVLAVEYKGVRPEVCVKCVSPCGYGLELTAILGMERPRTVTPGAILHDAVGGRDLKVSRVIKSMNRGRGR